MQSGQRAAFSGFRKHLRRRIVEYGVSEVGAVPGAGFGVARHPGGLVALLDGVSRGESEEAAEGTYNVHQGSVGRLGGVVREDALSGHLHEGGGRAEDQSSGVQGAGESGWLFWGRYVMSNVCQQ